MDMSVQQFCPTMKQNVHFLKNYYVPLYFLPWTPYLIVSAPFYHGKIDVVIIKSNKGHWQGNAIIAGALQPIGCLLRLQNKIKCVGLQREVVNIECIFLKKMMESPGGKIEWYAGLKSEKDAIKI